MFSSSGIPSIQVHIWLVAAALENLEIIPSLQKVLLDSDARSITFHHQILEIAPKQPVLFWLPLKTSSNDQHPPSPMTLLCGHFKTASHGTNMKPNWRHLLKGLVRLSLCAPSSVYCTSHARRGCMPECHS